MRIGVDVRCLMDGARTGVEEYTLHLLRAMIAAAPDDTFVLFANSRRPMQLPDFPERNSELRTFRYPNTLFTLFLKLGRRPHLDRLVGGAEVFFVPSFRLAPLSAACPLVLTVHDLSFAMFPEFFSRERRLWHRLMEPHALTRRAHRVIAVSSTTARDVASIYRVPPERIAVIHSGIPVSMRAAEAAISSDAILSHYAIRRPYILFLGTLEPRKNLGALLAAYARIRDAGFPHALVLAGMRGWIEQDFFDQAHAHPHARDIVLTGFIRDADKPAVYGSADLFVYPSYYEGFGFPPLEALACGTPVVTSAASAIPEIAGSWTDLVSPADPDELACVMLDRLRHPTRVPAWVSDAVRARYSWETAARATLHVLREAAAERSAGAARSL